MELSSILTPAHIRVPLVATDKTAVITELIDVLASQGALRDRDAVLAAVLKRESERTTGIGYGLAIPHGKSEGCARLAMAAGKPSEPVDFQSLDRRPVTFVVLLVSPPDQTGPHIQALAKVSRMMNIEDFRNRIGQVRSAQELYDVIRAAEASEGPPR
jgi:mannitol/fructose-specific phosphotransferase system IIA component (Ntr-type)